MTQEQEQSPQHIQEEVNEVFHSNRWRTSSRKGISKNWSFLTISLSHILSLWSLHKRWNSQELFHVSRNHWKCFQNYHIPSTIMAPHPTRGRQQTYNSYNKMWTPTSFNSQHRCKRSRRRRENHLYLSWRSSSSSLQSSYE